MNEHEAWIKAHSVMSKYLGSVSMATDLLALLAQEGIVPTDQKLPTDYKLTEPKDQDALKVALTHSPPPLKSLLCSE